MTYDRKDAESIHRFARRLLNRSVRELTGIDDKVANTYTGKGAFGRLIEEQYFKYKANSTPGPDFVEAGLELKTTPLKQIKKGLVSKERLVFNMIDYNTEYTKTFKTSSFWIKNNLLLLMFYFWEAEKNRLDYIFKIIRLWKFPEEDLKIIEDDWTIIKQKILDGKAHEISEGDTLYLGACTKGINNSQLRQQPNSRIMAKPRAYSLKSKYLNFIIEASLQEDAEAAIKDMSEYREGETFEEWVIRKFKSFYGKSEDEISKELGIELSNAKHKGYLISKAILGVEKEKIEEFEKADIALKTVRFETTGVLKESMSFPQIKYREIVNEDWEESFWYETLTRRFFFVIFQKDNKGELRLKEVKFWTMPVSDLEIAREFWEDTKQKIIDDDYRHFIKISDNRICHVRPKGVDGRDLMLTPSGRKEKKKCYWLNASYIKKVVTS